MNTWLVVAAIVLAVAAYLYWNNAGSGGALMVPTYAVHR